MLNYEQQKKLLQNNSPKLVVLDLSNKSLNRAELTGLVKLVEGNTQLGRVIWSEEQAHQDIIASNIEPILVRNNENFSAWPTDYEHIILSKHAYNNTSLSDDASIEFHDAQGKEVTRALDGWKVHEVFEDSASGYYGVLYYNKKEQRLVLAHRGTDSNVGDWAGIKEVLKDVKTDIRGVLRNRLVDQQIHGYVATRKSVSIASEIGAPLSVTGHSLGGWLAQLSVFYGYQHLQYKHMHAVVFDSPGILKMLEKLSPTGKTSDRHRLEDVLDITLYLSAPNPINSCHEHLYQHSYRIYPELPPTSCFFTICPRIHRKVTWAS